MVKRKGAFTDETKELIMRRANHRCDRCGMPAPHGQFHHRTPRRMGGTSRDDLAFPSNGLLLHGSCHEYVESHRGVAAQLGFLVGYGSLPSEAPVMLWNGWHVLNDDGTATPCVKPPPIHPSVGGYGDGVGDVTVGDGAGDG